MQNVKDTFILDCSHYQQEKYKIKKVKDINGAFLQKLREFLSTGSCSFLRSAAWWCGGNIKWIKPLSGQDAKCLWVLPLAMTNRGFISSQGQPLKHRWAVVDLNQQARI